MLLKKYTLGQIQWQPTVSWVRIFQSLVKWTPAKPPSSLVTCITTLSVLEDVFASEMATNSNNRAIAYRLVAAGRFHSQVDGENALKNYTRACSIGLTTEEAVHACLVLAGGGKKKDDQILKKDNVVR